MKTMLCVFGLLSLGCGCSVTPQSDDDSELLQDPNCDLMYYMTESCNRLGFIEKSEERCEFFAAEVKRTIAESFESEGEAMHEAARTICLFECRGGMDGKEVPSIAEVCLPETAEDSG